MENEKYLSEQFVLNSLDGVKQKNKKNIYTLNNGKNIVIRNNSDGGYNYYWYNLRSSYLNYDIDYIVFVVGTYGFYCLPFNIIKENAIAGNFSTSKTGLDIKIQLLKMNGTLYLNFIKSNSSNKMPIDIGLYWHTAENTNQFEINDTELLFEGAKKQIYVNAYERNAKARKQCIEYYGCYCNVCGFDFSKTYGYEYEDIMEVHHIKPLHKIDKLYQIDPIHDLIPICSNCHTILHKSINGKYITIEELKKRAIK